MKKILLLVFTALILSSCHRATCPAYSSGSMTGTEGSRENKQELFSPKMQKKKH
ncbi:MAG: hypothetical protein K1X63_11430 [Chitinophagales bacterium]|nr:hypothetical protein [Chitinophagales bacterium]